MKSYLDSVSPITTTTPQNNTGLTYIDVIKNEIDTITRGKHVIVFSGFSGLGYDNIEHLEKEINLILINAIEKYGTHNLCVTAGATSDGIGLCYEVAKKLEIKTIGIVSEQAKGFTSKHCDTVIYIKDTSSSWKVLDRKGKSYMVYIATRKDDIFRTGEFIALGGGDVTMSELQEAEKSVIKIKVYPYFQPSAEKLSFRKKESPEKDFTPVMTKYKNNTCN